MARPVEYNTLDVASLYSGKLMRADFSRVHRLAEALVGHEVWLHQIPRVMDELAPYIADFCPEVAVFDFSRVDPDTVDRMADELLSVAGQVQTIRTPLIEGRKASPSDDLPRGKSVKFLGGG